MTVRTLTRTEWDELCDDYKLVKPDGTHWMLSLEREGTCLVRIDVTGCDAWLEIEGREGYCCLELGHAGVHRLLADEGFTAA